MLLAKARNRDEPAVVGRQTGGRVFLFLQTDDFRPDYHAPGSRGVHFTEAPRREDYGTVAVFTDLSDHRWDLIQPNAPAGR